MSNCRSWLRSVPLCFFCSLCNFKFLDTCYCYYLGWLQYFCISVIGVILPHCSAMFFLNSVTRKKHFPFLWHYTRIPIRKKRLYGQINFYNISRILSHWGRFEELPHIQALLKTYCDTPEGEAYQYAIRCRSCTT